GGDPAFGIQLRVPRHLRRMVGIDAGHQCAGAAQFGRQFGCEKGANLVAKRFILGAGLHRPYPALGMKIALGRVNSSRPGTPFSCPKPDCFAPASGVKGVDWRFWLIHTVPVSSRCAIAVAAAISADHTAPARPYSLAL